jgi:hypothetical protein
MGIFKKDSSIEVKHYLEIDNLNAAIAKIEDIADKLSKLQETVEFIQGIGETVKRNITKSSSDAAQLSGFVKGTLEVLDNLEYDKKIQKILKSYETKSSSNKPVKTSRVQPKIDNKRRAGRPKKVDSNVRTR